MSGRMPIVCLIGLGILGIGLILHIIGLATPEWMYGYDSYSEKVNFGLWKICSGIICLVIDSTDAKFDAIRAFAIIAVIAGFCAGALAFMNIMLAFIGKPQVKILSLFSLLAGFAALSAVIISVAIFGSERQPSNGTSYGYSFILCIVGGILMAAGGFVGFIGHIQHKRNFV